MVRTMIHRPAKPLALAAAALGLIPAVAAARAGTGGPLEVWNDTGRSILLQALVAQGWKKDRVEDALQDLFLRLWNGSLAGVEDEAAYLSECLANIRVDLHRVDGVYRHAGDSLLPAPDRYTGPPPERESRRLGDLLRDRDRQKGGRRRCRLMDSGRLASPIQREDRDQTQDEHDRKREAQAGEALHGVILV